MAVFNQENERQIKDYMLYLNNSSGKQNWVVELTDEALLSCLNLKDNHFKITANNVDGPGSIKIHEMTLTWYFYTK